MKIKKYLQFKVYEDDFGNITVKYSKIGNKEMAIGRFFIALERREVRGVNLERVTKVDSEGIRNMRFA